jgi:ketosteroid isomerase-like protein
MSTLNIEQVKRLYRLFGERNIRAILDMLSPEVEWCEPPNPFNPCGGMHRGHDGFLKWANIGRQAEEILVLEVHKMLADDDSVAVVGHTKIRASATGKIYESDFVHVVTFRSGKVIKFQEYFDTYAAGEAYRQ